MFHKRSKRSSNGRTAESEQKKQKHVAASSSSCTLKRELDGTGKAHHLPVPRAERKAVLSTTVTHKVTTAWNNKQTPECSLKSKQTHALISDAVRMPGVTKNTTTQAIRVANTSELDVPLVLRSAGNLGVWKSVLQHLQCKPTVPFIVSGPTGCGKTYGLNVCAKFMLRDVICVDGCFFSSPAEFYTHLIGLQNAQTLLPSKGIILMEDIESLSADYLNVAKKIISQQRRSSDLSFIMTCTSIWSRAFEKLRTITHFECKRPGTAATIAVSRSVATNLMMSNLNKIVNTVSGDLRQLGMCLKSTSFVSGVDVDYGILQSTRLLLWSQLTIHEWLRLNTPSLQELVFARNYALLCEKKYQNEVTAMEACADMAGDLSYIEKCTYVCQPYLYGLSMQVRSRIPFNCYPTLYLKAPNGSLTKRAALKKSFDRDRR